MSNKPARIFITNQDIEVLCECSSSMATIHKSRIYEKLNIPKGSKLTIDNVCEYFKLTLEQATRVLPAFKPVSHE